MKPLCDCWLRLFPMSEPRLKPYQRGVADARGEYIRDRCPYPAWSDDASIWLMGFESGEAWEKPKENDQCPPT